MSECPDHKGELVFEADSKLEGRLQSFYEEITTGWPLEYSTDSGKEQEKEQGKVLSLLPWRAGTEPGLRQYLRNHDISEPPHYPDSNPAEVL